MSLTSRIKNRVRRSIRRRATKALDTLESWLLKAPRTAPQGAEPPPLVSPATAPERAVAPEPVGFPDPEDVPTADPSDLVSEEESELAEVHTLPTPESPPVATSAAGNGEGLQFAEVQELLDDMVRPALQMDGGDITLVRVEPEGDVFVELKGACTTCPSATITMRNGIERLMVDQLPGFRNLVEVHGVGNVAEAER
ncbi:MAG: NifU family protein [Myxococcota bacterium]